MPFKPGQSGNPDGRPKGIPDRRTRLRDIIEDDGVEIVRTLVDLAKEGDITALRLCIERLVPTVKAADVPVSLDSPGKTLVEQGREILSAVRSAELTPDQGEVLMKIVAQQAKFVELEQLQFRVEAIERALRARREEQ